MKNPDWGRISPEGIGGTGDLESPSSRIARAISGDHEEAPNTKRTETSFREPVETSSVLLNQLRPGVLKGRKGAKY
jgi:hypothetical protein